MAPTETYEQRVAATRKRFIEGLPTRTQAISDTLREAEGVDPLETKVRKVHRMMHDLVGNAAMLEYTEIEDCLRRGLRVAEEADNNGSTLSADEVRIIETALADANDVVEKI
ncbi:hypothetical protein DSM110093_02539 [Sulfitobacter sp. DSM 110093]|uniref:hypothetical protein n=1 Tax=Sulfitobacter sp. DSM 110093 TaxID=2883127 RepID=UPI001FAB3A66|nr:hypothetical protein [Sulfitobacter sp. DSM 110093]UOA32737.1 hypothetical protein DSM110093_02539 [Sulfitobacter sp. DSM 110093]